MLPSIDIRIQNLVKALQQVVLPAVDPGNKLALEQAQLAIAHLNVIAQQWDKAHQFETGSLRAMQELALALSEIAEGGERTLDSGARVAAAAKVIDLKALPNVCLVSETIESLGTALDELIFAISADGSELCRKKSQAIILDYGLIQARRLRVWFAGTGLDPDRAGLPSIESMLAGNVT